MTLQVNPDASLIVQETITFNFRGRHTGILRMIPVRDSRAGHEWTLRLTGIHGFDESRQELRTEVSYPGHYARIKAWVPGAVDTARTVTLVYRVRRGLLAWEDRDELYWNVTGTEWEVPIREAEAFVIGPPGVPDALVRSAAYTGSRGATGRDYVEERSAQGIAFRSTRPFWPREGLTVAVDWPRGHIPGPTRAQEAWWLLGDHWPLGVPLLTLVLLLWIWQAYGRDPASNTSIKPEYEPPRGIVPAEAGTLVDERAEPRDFVATLVDLAVRGYLHIEQVTTAFGETDFLFKRLKPVAGDPELKPVEIFALAKLFGADWALNLRLLSEVKRDYDSTFPPVRDAIYRTMVADRLFPVSPDLVRTVWAGAGLAIFGVGGWLYLAQPAWLGQVSWPLPVGIAASGLVVLALSRAMPRRTLRGARVLVRVLGFQEFLERAEKDRLERMPGDTLHRLVPWAIALGVTERWIVNFAGLEVDPPAWYTGRDPFTLSAYQRDLAAFDSRAQEAILTSRRSGGDAWSGGSRLGGGSGGGSSGGGLGGGGGGTF